MNPPAAVEDAEEEEIHWVQFAGSYLRRDAARPSSLPATALWLKRPRRWTQCSTSLRPYLQARMRRSTGTILSAVYSPKRVEETLRFHCPHECSTFQRTERSSSQVPGSMSGSWRCSHKRWHKGSHMSSLLLHTRRLSR